MIGTAQPELSFIDFIVNVGPPAVVAYLVTTAILYATFRRQLAPEPERVELLETLDASAGLSSRREVVTVSVILGLTILGFFVHGALGVEPPTIALSGATGWRAAVAAGQQGFLVPSHVRLFSPLRSRSNA